MLKNICDRWSRWWSAAYHYSYRHRLGAIGRGTTLGRGTRIDAPEKLFLGEEVTLGDYLWISTPRCNMHREKAAHSPPAEGCHR
jgi:hypothetical protein